jgi:hypothetical protein
MKVQTGQPHVLWLVGAIQSEKNHAQLFLMGGDYPCPVSLQEKPLKTFMAKINNHAIDSNLLRYRLQGLKFEGDNYASVILSPSLLSWQTPRRIHHHCHSEQREESIIKNAFSTLILRSLTLPQDDKKTWHSEWSERLRIISEKIYAPVKEPSTVKFS